MPAKSSRGSNKAKNEAAVVQAQLDSLDDTDCYASVWEDLLNHQRSLTTTSDTSAFTNLWGGKGRGGRGLARRTIQPYDVVLEGVRLQYLGMGDETLLDNASLKLLAGHTYVLCGPNGSGKSTLLQRMHAQKIPGWSVQWSSLYLPPNTPSQYKSQTPLQVVLDYHAQLSQTTQVAIESQIEKLQHDLDALDMENEPDEMERLCESLSLLEDQLAADTTNDTGDQPYTQIALEALHTMGIDNDTASTKSMQSLSQGQQKRVLLSLLLFLQTASEDTGGDAAGNVVPTNLPTLILLDEPTAHLDVLGLLQLRQMVENYQDNKTTTLVLVSHDVDFINDVATDIIEWQDRKLYYYPGNYDNYRLTKEQLGLHELRQSAALEKKTGQLVTTLQHLAGQPTPKRGGSKKKAKTIANHRKKLERHQQDIKQAEVTSTGGTSSTSALVSKRKGLTAQKRLKLAEVLKRVPDKNVQFTFPDAASYWGEPLLTALEVGFRYKGSTDTAATANCAAEQTSSVDGDDPARMRVRKKPGYLFDCVDFCVDEYGRYAILGPTACGKSTLLKLFARQIKPTEGALHFASGVTIGFLDASTMQELKAEVTQETTALDYLQSKYPKKNDEELRCHCSGFGLSPRAQTKTPIVYLSSGETFRLALALELLRDPPMIVLDDPTLYLDVQSVSALIYGLNHWKGTLLVTSADTNFLRSIENLKCAVLMPEQGKLMRLNGGVDDYLASFASNAHSS